MRLVCTPVAPSGMADMSAAGSEASSQQASGSSSDLYSCPSGRVGGGKSGGGMLCLFSLIITVSLLAGSLQHNQF